MADNITIRQGETLELYVQIDDPQAHLVKLLVAKPDLPPIITEIAYFTTLNGVRSAMITSDNTDHPIGDYEYMFVIIYTDDVVEKLPDSDCCDDECDLPTFTICKTIDEVVS